MNLALLACLLLSAALSPMAVMASDASAESPPRNSGQTDAAVAGDSTSAAPPLTVEQTFRLLSKATPHAERQQLFNAAGAASRSGHGWSTFLI